MSCNTKTSLAAVIDAVNAQLNNNYVDRDDPRIDQGVFTEPTIRGGLMLDEAAKLDFCGYVTECGQREPFGKQWVDRPLYPYNTLVSYDDGGEIKSRWQDIDDVVAGTEIGESYIAYEETRNLGLQGYTIIDSFELGATITQPNQALRHAADGKLYRWAGELPKVVPANSTPTSSGGMGDNAWLEVSDFTLRQDLANPDKGATMVARGAVTVDSVADLVELPEEHRKEGLRYLVKGYHAGSDLGGGEFRWDPTASASDHNGSTVIATDRAFPLNWGDAVQITEWLEVTTSTGVGCFVKVGAQSETELETFGARGDGSTDNGLIANFALALKRPVILARGVNLISTTVRLDFIGATVKGRGHVDIVVPSLTEPAFLLLARACLVCDFKATNHGPEASFIPDYVIPTTLITIGEHPTSATQCEISGINIRYLRVAESHIRHNFGYSTKLYDMTFQYSRATIAAVEIKHAAGLTPFFAFMISMEKCEFTGVYEQVEGVNVAAIKMEGGDLTLNEVIIQDCYRGIVIGAEGSYIPILNITSLYFELNRSNLIEVLDVPYSPQGITAPIITIDKLRDTGLRDIDKHTFYFNDAKVTLSNIWSNSLSASNVTDSPFKLTIDCASSHFFPTRTLSSLQLADIRWINVGRIPVSGISSIIRYTKIGPNSSFMLKATKPGSNGYKSKVQVYQVAISSDNQLSSELISSIDGTEEGLANPDFTITYDGTEASVGFARGGNWSYEII